MSRTGRRAARMEHVLSISQTLRGTPVSSGIAHGTAYVITRADRAVVPRRAVEEADIEGELARFEFALIKAEKDLIALRKDVAERIGTGEADIFAAQALVVRDHALHDQVVDVVRQKKVNVEAALAEVVERFVRAFDQVPDAYLRERAADIRDVGRRVFAALIADDSLYRCDIPEGSILVADEL
jgi:phosphotransferase system enzyme I (PtsI)